MADILDRLTTRAVEFRRALVDIPHGQVVVARVSPLMEFEMYSALMERNQYFYFSDKYIAHFYGIRWLMDKSVTGSTIEFSLEDY